MQEHILQKIEKVLDQEVRPSLKNHYGDLQVISFEGGILKFKLLGQCSSCPSAYLTVEELVKKKLTEALPEVEEAIWVSQVSDDMLDKARSILQRTNTPKG